MAWTGLILVCLSNILVPFIYTNPREDFIYVFPFKTREDDQLGRGQSSADQFICGLVKTLDQNRFLAEQNSDFIFQFVDNTNDPSPDYKTKIFDVAKLSDSGELRKLEQFLDLEYEDGLFTLMMAPPTAECNQETFKNAKDGKDYYPVYVGDKDGITDALGKYKNQANIHRKAYNQCHPKLCGTFTLMQSRAAKSRAENLATIFNFPFNKDVSRSIDIDEHQGCRGATETKNAIIISEVFDTSIEPSFKETEQKVFEFEGVFQATLTRASSNKAAVIIVKPILDGSATADDVDPFESLVVFKPYATEVDVFVSIREDGLSESDEEFKLEISNFAKTRNKRDIRQTIDVSIVDTNVWKFGDRILFETLLCSNRFNTDRLTIQPTTSKEKPKNMESNTIVELVLSQEAIILIKKSYFSKTIREKKFKSRKPVTFIEIYDAQITKHRQYKKDERIKAYYYPYQSGQPETEIDDTKVLNVGWVDIPKRPTKDQPKHAITGTMNGCATVVMTKKNDDENLRVYHLQSPGPRGKETWNNYIEIIKKHHDVDAVLTSFSWEDYGYSDRRAAEIANDPSAYAPAAVVLLIYDTASQEWYYASQMNLYGMHVNGEIVSNEESIFNGKTEQVLVSKMKDGTTQSPRPPAKRCYLEL